MIACLSAWCSLGTSDDGAEAPVQLVGKCARIAELAALGGLGELVSGGGLERGHVGGVRLGLLGALVAGALPEGLGEDLHHRLQPLLQALVLGLDLGGGGLLRRRELLLVDVLGPRRSTALPLSSDSTS